MLHKSQVLVKLLPNLPSGHIFKHLALFKYAFGLHVKHDYESPPVQVAQEKSHGKQEFVTESAQYPAGQAVKH